MSILILIDLLVELVAWQHVNIKNNYYDILLMDRCRLLTISIQFSSKYNICYLI